MTRSTTYWYVRAGSVIAAVVVLIGLVSWAETGLALAKDSIEAKRATFGIQPSGSITPDHRPNLSYTTSGAARLVDHFAVFNYADAPLTLQLYATDAHTTADGGFDLLPRSQHPRDIGTWVTIDRSSATIPKRSHVVVGFALNIPTNAGPGDHSGGIVAAINGRTTDAQGKVINLEQRVGLRLYARVAGELRPELTITQLSGKYESRLNPFGRGRVLVNYTVTNTGNLRLAAHQMLEVRGLLGVAHQTLGDLPELLPGDSVILSSRVDKVIPAVRVQTKVSLTPITKQDGIDPVLRPVSRSVSVVALSIPSTAVLLVLFVAPVTALSLRARRLTSGKGPRHGKRTRPTVASHRAGLRKGVEIR